MIKDSGTGMGLPLSLYSLAE